MSTRVLRDIGKTVLCLILSWLYFPHLLLYLCNKEKFLLDIHRNSVISIKLHPTIMLLFLLHFDSCFRTLFYHRIGPVAKAIIGWWRPGDKYFRISATTKIGHGLKLFHPYSTIINAESIGDNCHVAQCTTIGYTAKGRPTIGNNVGISAHCVVIGNIRIGDNVIVGAGSVVVKDVPSNCIIAGNPAKIIRYYNENE